MGLLARAIGIYLSTTALGAGVLMVAASLAATAPGGTPDPAFEALLPVGAVVAAIGLVGCVGILWRPAPAGQAAPPRFTPGPPLVATGGEWRLDDPEGLFFEPNRIHVVPITFTPAAGFRSDGIRTLLAATESYWPRLDHDEQQVEKEVVCEIAGPIHGPTEFEAGVPVTWEVCFDLDGLVPSTSGDPDLIGCEWLLEVRIERGWHPDPKLVQPVVVTQPRDRLNAGIVPQAEFSRYEETHATDAASGLVVGMRVTPAPLDLAAPAAVRIELVNPGPPLRARAVRVEIVSRVTVRDGEGYVDEVVLWAGERRTKTIGTGRSAFELTIPAVNRPFADADLRHGSLRGLLRVVVDLPARPDVRVERDLCLCLETPERLRVPDPLPALPA